MNSSIGVLVGAVGILAIIIWYPWFFGEPAQDHRQGFPLSRKRRHRCGKSRL
ncbi:MAG: hypothetical protein LBQ30_03030 [Treponema sp.]|jgi:hypothetical protein|nr:hypothetical protein [Treponema sp.]